MSESTRDRGVSITLKYDKGHDASWAVFTGTVETIREDITKFFGLEQSVVEGLTASELVVMVTDIAHAKGNASAVLGAVPIPGQRASSWGQAAAQAADAPPAEHPLIGQINAATSVDALKQLWAKNQNAFANKDVEAAYKAKGKALKEAAK